MDRTPGWGRNDTGGAGSMGGNARFTADAGAGAGGTAGGPWGVEAADFTGPGSGGYPAAEPDALPGRLPSGYQLLRKIGAGRYSSVLLCREEAQDQEVALKMLNLTVEDEALRLAAHAELLSVGAASKHPCSVLVEDAGFTPDNRPFLVQQFCRGGNAQAKLLNSGPFPVDEVIIIGIRLALSLASSHRRGVLHLDVRPANILFDESGDALLADHGVARILQRCAPQLGAVFDPMYSCREMFGWEKAGPSADVYSLGATLYALLNGLPAYAEAGSTSWSALYNEVFRGELPPPNRPDVPLPLIDLIRRMMASNAEGRPPLTEVHRVLRHLLPPTYAARVPALDPEPAPEPMLPGWDPADDVTPEEQAEAERIGREHEAEMKRRNRRRMIAAIAALVVFAGGATAITLLVHNNDKAKKAGSQASASASPVANPSAQEAPAAQLPALMPQHVTVTRANGQVQVSWRPPKSAAVVAGYYVQASTAAGKQLGLKSAARTEPQAVFTDPATTAPGTCYTVATLITVGGGTVEYAPSQTQCQASNG